MKQNTIKIGYVIIPNMYVVQRGGVILYETISSTRNHSKKRFMKDFAGKWDDWDSWEQKGYQCIQVDITFKPSKP